MNILRRRTLPTTLSLRIARIDALRIIYADLAGITGPDFLQALMEDAWFMGGALSGVRRDRLVQAACERWLIAREGKTPVKRLQVPVQLPIDLVPGACWITKDGIAYDGSTIPHTDDGRRGLRILLVAAIYYNGPLRWPPAIARALLQDLMHWLEAGEVELPEVAV